MFSRRTFLTTAASLPLPGGIVAGLPRPTTGSGRGRPRTAEEVLVRLKEGNERFAAGRVQHAHEAAEWRKQLVAGQHPFATVVGCSDSRVPTELVFDQGFGDLFVIRLAGNIIEPGVLASIQYAVHHLKTPLMVLLGHEGCGAVTAALEALDGKAHEPRLIEGLVRLIEPGLKALDPKLQGPARVSAAVELNVRHSLKQLASTPEVTAREGGKPQIVGGVYNLESGRVRFLE